MSVSIQDALRFNTIQTKPIEEAGVWKERFIKVTKLVFEVAKCTFIAIASIVFYLANPSLFAVGFLVGLVIDEKVRETVDKVEKICFAKPWVIPLVGVGAFLALPVAIAVGSFASGAYLSSKIAGMVPADYDPRTRFPAFIRNNF